MSELFLIADSRSFDGTGCASRATFAESARTVRSLT